jgi:PPOX class probable F420-dependent enzyme
MPNRMSAAEASDQQKATTDSYFAPLASAGHMLLTTFKPNGLPVSISVRGVAHGDRAYIRVWSRSGTAKRLRHEARVQVTPCTVLGLCSLGTPLGATARLLPGAAASQVASRLAPKYPAQHRIVARLLHRAWRWQMLHYELLP